MQQLKQVKLKGRHKSITQRILQYCIWMLGTGMQSYTHTHTHPFNGPMPGTTRVSRYQKGKTNLDFTEARYSEWQWHQLGTCKSAPRSRQITMPTPHHSVFLQAGCPSCRPTNSVKALKAQGCVYWPIWSICLSCSALLGPSCRLPTTSPGR